MKITAKELNKGYEFTYEKDENNSITLYKEHGIFFIQGYFNDSYFCFTGDTLKQAKEIFNKNLKQIKTS